MCVTTGAVTSDRINPFLVTFFQPLIQLENACRGFNRPLRPSADLRRQHGTTIPNHAMERTADRYRVHILSVFDTPTPSDARPRPPSLILFFVRC